MQIKVYQGEGIRIRFDFNNKKANVESDYIYWKDTKKAFNKLLKKEIGLDYNSSNTISCIWDFEDVINDNFDRIIQALNLQ